ncbi:MAG: ornithine cyclodeaminase family protein [Clostridia bacterium]|nr:ornithine cyclodeaminase family protein [Clostridia bacterium]
MERSTLILSGDDVRGLLTVQDAFEAMREAFAAFAEGQVQQPPIVSLHMDEYNGELDIKSGCSLRSNVIGVKMASGYWDNPKNYGLPAAVALICLYDARSSYPLCILDGGDITYYRTAAAGALAATLLARPESETLALIGAGGLARMHLEATLAYFPIRRVLIYSADAEQARQLAREAEQKHPGVRAEACADAESAVREADIISTATPSREPIVMRAWVRPGTHINAFGADMQGKQELETALTAASRLVLDNPAEALVRGESQHAYAAGLIGADCASLGDIVIGKCPGRQSAEEITVFDSTGMSVQDIAASLRIYEKAIKLNKGMKIKIV